MTSTHTPARDGIPGFVSTPGLEMVAYHALNDRPCFKIAPYPYGDRWFLYTGHLGHRGWSILDVRDPTRPELVGWLDGPANTGTAQVQAADGILMTSLEAIGGDEVERGVELWGLDPERSHDEGVVFWDISEPTLPRRLGQFRTGALAPIATCTPVVAEGTWQPTCVDMGEVSRRELSTAPGNTPQAKDFFIPDRPCRRLGLLPRQLATQTEDVVVDSGGYIYISDKNHGLFILRSTVNGIH